MLLPTELQCGAQAGPLGLSSESQSPRGPESHSLSPIKGHLRDPMPALSFHSLVPGRPLGLWDGRTSLLHATQAPEAQEAQKAEEEDSEKRSHDCADHPEHRAGFCGHQRPRARLCSRRPCAVTWRMRRVQATQWKEAAPRAHALPLMGPQWLWRCRGRHLLEPARQSAPESASMCVGAPSFCSYGAVPPW